MKITITTSGFDNIEENLEKAGEKAAHAVAIQVAKDTEPFVPALTKSLSNRVRTEGSRVIYPGPYARFLYYGKVMVDPSTGSPWAKRGVTKKLTSKKIKYNKSVHSQATDHWFEASKAQNKDKWVHVAGNSMKKELE